MADRYSDSYKRGKRDGEQAYSDFGYDSSKYRQYGSEQQRNYAAGWEEAREDKHYEQRRQEEREEQEREEQRRAERLAQERYEQECYEQQMYEQQQQEQYEEKDEVE